MRNKSCVASDPDTIVLSGTSRELKLDAESGPNLATRRKLRSSHSLEWGDVFRPRWCRQTCVIMSKTSWNKHQIRNPTCSFSRGAENTGQQPADVIGGRAGSGLGLYDGVTVQRFSSTHGNTATWKHDIGCWTGTETREGSRWEAARLSFNLFFPLLQKHVES